MAKPFRSPLLGYNHNLTHLGRVFHVQSEDSGPGMPRVFTHLFYEGTILVSRKQEYDAQLPDDKVRALMQLQARKSVMKDLMQARLDDRIVAFFAARGENMEPMRVAAVAARAVVPDAVEGAMPEAPLDVSSPVMVLPGGPAAEQASGAAMASAGVVMGENHVDTDADDTDRALPAPIGPRRTVTRAIESAPRRGATPSPVVVRPSDARQSPFVRSGAPAVTKMSSADGVVVQRNVVIGGPSVSSGRPTRIRPPVPYVVTGGGAHRTAAAARASAAVTQPMAPPVLSPASSASPSTQPSRTPAPVSAVEASPRVTGAFGVGLADDKSLDEVILEYLWEGRFGVGRRLPIRFRARPGE